MARLFFELHDKAHHDHIVCLQCGHVTEFVNDEIEKLQTKVAEEHGFRIIEHSLIIYADSIKKPCNHKKEFNLIFLWHDQLPYQSP